MFTSLLCLLINSVSVYYLFHNSASARCPLDMCWVSVGTLSAYYIFLRAGGSLPGPGMQRILHGSVPPGAILNISSPSATWRISTHDQTWTQAVGVVERRNEGHLPALLQAMWARGCSASVSVYLRYKHCC